MKKYILFFIFWVSILPCLSYTTDASKFAETQYTKQSGNAQIHINVKKEHTIENLQKIDEKNIPAITFGYGDMRIYKKAWIKRGKKIHISYICLLNDDYNPVWSYIIPLK